MQIQLEDANARVIKEQEAARKAIEEAPPVIKETPVMVQDTAKIDALTSEVESLKVRAQRRKQQNCLNGCILYRIHIFLCVSNALQGGENAVSFVFTVLLFG